VTAVAFELEANGRLASYSAPESKVRVWSTSGGGLLDSLHVRGTLLLTKPLPGLENDVDASTCKIAWSTGSELKLRREDGKTVMIKL
jgi:hypothetical protein